MDCLKFSIFFFFFPFLRERQPLVSQLHKALRLLLGVKTMLIYSVVTFENAVIQPVNICLMTFHCCCYAEALSKQ